MLVGKTTIPNSRHERIRQINITSSEQINVLADDVIGVFFTSNKGTCVPYDLCKLNTDLYGNQLESVDRKGNPDTWNINDTYDFKFPFRNDICKVWSFSVIVQ